MARPKPHRRHIKWRSLGGEPVITLAKLIEERLVEPLLHLGFEWVDVHYGDDQNTVSGREIMLERMVENDFQMITFSFDTYARPAFQVHVARRRKEEPHDFVFSGRLVRSNRQYFHFWGKPWWLPKSLWSKRMAVRTVETIARYQEQCLALLEDGRRGPNISRKS